MKKMQGLFMQLISDTCLLSCIEVGIQNEFTTAHVCIITMHHFCIQHGEYIYIYTTKSVDQQAFLLAQLTDFSFISTICHDDHC